MPKKKNLYLMSDKKSALPQFIHTQFVEDVSLADEIIEFFHEHPYLHVKGRVIDTDGNRTHDVKKSTEIVIEDQLVCFPAFSELNRQVQIVLDEYLKIYPQCNTLAKFVLVPYNVQYYKPGEGYLSWHYERTCGLEPLSSRVLAFMFYCHTIEKGGGTEFLHQDFINKSEKGKVSIFPVDWTFTHKGEPSKKEKMIVTGWWNFAQIQEK